MPRPKKPGDETKEVKKRSRNGCWPCKARKVKCGEEKPSCATCIRQGETCDYSIRLNWDGRSKKKDLGPGVGVMSLSASSPQASHSPPKIDIQNGTPPQPNLQNTFQLGVGGDVGLTRVSPTHSRTGSLTGSVDNSLPSISHFSHGVEQPTGSPNPSMLPVPPVLRNPTWSDSNIPTLTSNGPMVPFTHLRPNVSPSSYPSPADSGFGSPSIAPNGFNFNSPANQMLPPMSSSGQGHHSESARSPYNGAKRIRMSPRADSFPRDPGLVPRSSSLEEVPRIGAFPSTPTSFPLVSNPLTPAASSGSILSGDNDDRRISVSSLLSDSTEERRSSATTSDPQPSRRGSLFVSSISYSETDTYGYDHGHPDLDIPRNNDTMAISGSSPSAHSDLDAWLNDAADLTIPEFGFGLTPRSTVFAKGGYYASAVPIKIPRKLDPLPATLTEHPMNLLYFHHFLSHTARVLVPHDCPENPFKTILPKMAVQDPNLLNLMLAYSACHRARLLGHPEPKNRIALWVRDLFPHLRSTMQSADEQVSNANVATAIMLASLEIISPSSFGVDVPWQNHLNLALNIIRSRLRPNSVSRKDTVMYFLTRWMAYLDILGSLSGRRNEAPLFSGNYWVSSHENSHLHKDYCSAEEEAEDDDDYTIDCLMGFTTRCIVILAQVASLAHQCASQRLNIEQGVVNEAWTPSHEILQQAEQLRRELEYARNHKQHQCLHNNPILSKNGITRRSSYAEMTEQDIQESLATNSAFHWAGLIHLLRRVHNLPRSDPQVQCAVREIVKILSTIREDSGGMACFLFPMFTAGVEAESKVDQAEVLSRMKTAEQLGLFQVSRARKIMEKSWETGKNWELLVSGEFLG